MNKTCIIGASGYTGAELVKIISRHPKMKLDTCFVSDGSQYAGLTVAQVHSELSGICDLALTELSKDRILTLKDEYDLIFLATPHEFSHDHLPAMVGGKAKVFDLSGAFRIKDADVFAHYYGFEHTQVEALKHTVYGLAEWYNEQISQAQYIAVPGCYPTASLLALKPLIENDLLNLTHMPVINATSGVSGAGKKASNTTSFYEVSLQAYGVLGHRHMPEIEAYAGCDVIFTPHLGAFKRGILATITAFVQSGVTEQQIKEAYQNAYKNQPLIRLPEAMPKVDQVAHSPFCDIAFAYNENKQCVVITSAIDNLLKGAASQAVQCANIACSFEETAGLL